MNLVGSLSLVKAKTFFGKHFMLRSIAALVVFLVVEIEPKSLFGHERLPTFALYSGKHCDL